MRRPKSTCVLALLVVAGCGDGTGPRAFPGRFELFSYEGWQLPVVLQVVTVIPAVPGAPGASCENRLTGMTLEFTGRDYVATRRTDFVCDDGRPATTSASSEAGTFTTSGDSVTMTASETLPIGASTHRWFAVRARGELRVYRQETAVNFTEYVVDTQPLVFAEAR